MDDEGVDFNTHHEEEVRRWKSRWRLWAKRVEVMMPGETQGGMGEGGEYHVRWFNEIGQPWASGPGRLGYLFDQVIERLPTRQEQLLASQETLAS